MKYILLFMFLISISLAEETPTFYYKKNNLMNLSEIDNPYCEGTIRKDSVLYVAIEQDKQYIAIQTLARDPRCCPTRALPLIK